MQSLAGLQSPADHSLITMAGQRWVQTRSGCKFIWELGSGQPETMEDLQKYFESHKDKRDFPGHTSKVHSVAWSCEGKWLASGSLDKTVGVFHLERSKLVSTWRSRDALPHPLLYCAAFQLLHSSPQAPNSCTSRSDQTLTAIVHMQLSSLT